MISFVDCVGHEKGDQSLVIRQMRGKIDCKAPGIQLLRHKSMEKVLSCPGITFYM